MKKKALCALLSVAMVATMFTACGSNDESGSSSAGKSGTEDSNPGYDDGYTYTATDDGKVLNIYCWNEEFKSRLTDHYPGYEKIDETSGTIGDVTVKFTIVPSDDNAYQNNLDETFLNNGAGQANAAADDKIDIFLVEADYALKYVDTTYSIPLSEIGVNTSDLSDQYKYTQDIVTDSAGKLKGSSWQGCPGIMFYNRAAATELFGSDDSDTVQAKVKDWATFKATAKDVVAAGYKMTATTNDTFRVYSNNVSSKWVVDGKINVDANIKAWVDDTKELYDMGACAADDLWSDAWSAGFYPEGKVFCYFGPAWLINFCMAADVDGSIANQGGWGACVGPQSFFWGGTWICVADGTDNSSLCKDIVMNLTGNKDIMIDIVKADDDFVNNQPAMEEMAADASYSSAVLGGINPLQFYVDGVKTIDLSNLSSYDQGCNEAFQAAMKEYFLGNSTYDEALEQFYTAVIEKYPNLSK